MKTKEIKFYKEKGLLKGEYNILKVSLHNEQEGARVYDATSVSCKGPELRIERFYFVVEKNIKSPYTDKTEFASVKKDLFDNKFKETLKLIK